MQHREIVKPFVYEKISLEEVREEERAKRRSASDSWGTIKRVWGYLAEKKLFLGLVLFMVLISSAMSLLGPYLVDRKSTRLNSSHVAISYAVFCLKKKMRT